MKREDTGRYPCALPSISLPPGVLCLSVQDRQQLHGNLYRSGTKAYRYFQPIRQRAGPFRRPVWHIWVLLLSMKPVCFNFKPQESDFSRMDCQKGRFVEAMAFLYSLRIDFSEDFLPRRWGESCTGLPKESMNCIKFYKKAFTYMVFLDMGGICCIICIGNYYTIMKCLKYFN